jgi:proline racemase
MRTEVITFDVVDFVYPYNAIFGRNTINKFTAFIHQGYLLMKIPTTAGVILVYGSQRRPGGPSATCQCITGRSMSSTKMRATKRW